MVQLNSTHNTFYTKCINVDNCAYTCRSTVRKFTKQAKVKQFRDRAPSTLPLKRILLALRKGESRPFLKHYFVQTTPKSSILNKIAKNYKQCCFQFVHMQHIFINSFAYFKLSVNLVQKSIKTEKHPSCNILNHQWIHIPGNYNVGNQQYHISQRKLMLSGDIELNPGPVQNNIPTRLSSNVVLVCESITFSRKLSGQTHPTLHLDGNALREVNSHIHLGLKLTSNFTWNHHIQSIHKKASKMMNLLKSVKYKLHRSTLISLYKSLVRPLMEYADVIWDGCTESEANLLEGIQNESARIVTGAIKGTNRVRLLNELCWEDLKTRRFLHKLSLLYKIINCLTPSYLRDLLPPYVYQRSDHHLRSNENFTYIPTSTERFKKSFSHQ